ncbi:unnamed protein product [Cyprideis torosa]|uniref:Uncharacterized protein n=1 Tax=Cyprideis torosa TaxID=163714 RepID=A0A7R8WIB9_9CRUS|nr:unnamed protein product [Cyprideis torosa]CAG0894517.1 unnamed protein product [Cyprideis torosa]
MTLTDEWPCHRPIPLPRWNLLQAPCQMHFHDILEFEDFVGKLDFVLQCSLATHPYNSVSNFLTFYESFKVASFNNRALSLRDHFRNTTPKLIPNRHTCVGLTLALKEEVETTLGIARGHFFVAACEEIVSNPEEFASRSPPNQDAVQMEHVLLALNIRIDNEERQGLLFLDPGYHTSRVIIVMNDGVYPNTGWFRGTSSPAVRRDLCFNRVSSDYVECLVRDTRGSNGAGMSVDTVNVIYVGHHFLSAVNHSEHRNIIYPRKFWIARDMKGTTTAGLTLSLERAERGINCFINGGQEQLRLLQSTDLGSMFLTRSEFFTSLASELKLDVTTLLSTLHQLQCVLYEDPAFISQVLNINQDVEAIGMGDLQVVH